MHQIGKEISITISNCRNATLHIDNYSIHYIILFDSITNTHGSRQLFPVKLFKAL